MSSRDRVGEPRRTPSAPQRAMPPEVQLSESYQVLVDCRDEADQQAVYERLTAEGYACRVLTI